MCLFPTGGTGIQFPVGVYLNQKLEKKNVVFDLFQRTEYTILMYFLVGVKQ